MYQLVYISTARLTDAGKDIERILTASRRNNMRDGITGLLVFDGKRFLQALEGPKPLVDAALDRIRTDTRHRATVILSKREIDAAQFGGWEMAWRRVENSATTEALGDIVDGIVAGVPDPNTRALFSSFVRIDRTRAA